MSLPTPFESGFLDITDYRFMEEVETDGELLQDLSPPQTDLGPDCTGIVLHRLFGGADSDKKVRLQE